MNILEFTSLVWVVSASAGFLGALTGLGGGVVIVPLLTLMLGVDLRYAIGASLIAVIATSCGAASAFVKEGYTNLRLGMFLEVATTAGALVGASLALHLPTRAIAIVFGLVLLATASFARQPRQLHLSTAPDGWATWLKLNSRYPTPEGQQAYSVRSVPFGFGLMAIAGALSGLLGIGSGAFKVLAMDQVMQIPFKVSTTTSNFMIGVTAAASAGVYLGRGYVDPGLAMPVMLGVLCGALLGAKVLIKARIGLLRSVFNGVILLLALQMIYGGLTGGI